MNHVGPGITANSKTFGAPIWAKEAVIYHIFIDRFSPSPNTSWGKPQSLSGFFNGTIAGINSRLDYLVDLGVNTLYLSPLLPSPSHHGYDATDYFEVEPRLGNIADLQTLISALHDRGMHLLLDYVPNHFSSMHPFFQSAISDPQSPYRQWFTFTDYPDQYLTFRNVQSLPKLDLTFPAARKYMLDAATYWLKLGVDGFRIDHVPGPYKGFWREFAQVVKSINPQAWLIGEIPEEIEEQMTYYGLLDGCLNFILCDLLRQFFAYSSLSVQEFASHLTRHLEVIPKEFSAPSFLDNHDMDRFLWLSGNNLNRLKLAALSQFTLPNQPIIYYGTETGLSQWHGVDRPGQEIGHLEEARLPMRWGEEQDKSLINYYRSLIKLRQQFLDLILGDFHLHHAKKSSFSYKYNKGKDELLVVFNLSCDRMAFDPDMFKNEPVFCSAEGLVDQFENGSCYLPPLSGTVFTNRLI